MPLGQYMYLSIVKLRYLDASRQPKHHLHLWYAGKAYMTCRHVCTLELALEIRSQAIDWSGPVCPARLPARPPARLASNPSITDRQPDWTYQGRRCLLTHPWLASSSSQILTDSLSINYGERSGRWSDKRKFDADVSDRLSVAMLRYIILPVDCIQSVSDPCCYM